MKTMLRAGILLAVLLSAACQTLPAVDGTLSARDMENNRRAVAARIAEPEEQTLYFSDSGQYSSTPVAGGYVRRVLGKTADGGWVVQDFYADAQTKQTDPFVIFHPDGLRNFDNDVVDGLVVWYAPGGERVQTQTFRRGKADGWLNVYDLAGRLRDHSRYENGKEVQSAYYDASGRKRYESSGDAESYWYDNGQQAVAYQPGVDIRAWLRDGSEVKEQKIVYWVWMSISAALQAEQSALFDQIKPDAPKKAAP